MDKHHLRFYALLAFFGIPVLYGFISWSRADTATLIPPQLTAVNVYPGDSTTLLASTENTLLKKTNDRWETLWSASWRQTIQKIVSFKEWPQSVFVLTSNGLFEFDLNRKKALAVYQGKREQGKSVLSFAIDPADKNRWWLGTQTGLYQSTNRGKTWLLENFFAGQKSISLLARSKTHLFVGADKKLYRLESEMRFMEVLSLRYEAEKESLGPEDFEENQVLAEEFSETHLETNTSFSDMAASGSDDSQLWVGTSQGVFESKDHGLSWKAFTSLGLKSTRIQRLCFVPSADRLFAVTEKGIYGFQKNQNLWEELYQGLGREEIQDVLAFEADSKTFLLALTANGLVQFPISSEAPGQNARAWLPSPARYELFEKLTGLEPTARDIQQAVIRYANLKNEKIRRWHWQSRLKALVPQVSLTHAVDRTASIDIDRGGTSDPDRYILGPDQIDHGWDLDIGWDLADILWSSDQTSIDSREKLMVELRQELLSEATRIYHERRRLQAEILFSSSEESESLFWEQRIRLEELTASLDAMTDGFLSSRLEMLNHSYPELKQIWQNQNSFGEADLVKSET